MRNFARAMVLTTVVALMTAMIAAQGTLSHGSGTYFATFIVVPFIVAPGILVWFKPRAHSFGIWAVCSGFASIIYLAAGTPYSWERELAGWQVIVGAMYTAIFISVVGSTIMAWTLAASTREALPDSSLARRLRSIAKLAPILGAIVVISALVVVERNHATVAFVIGSFIALTCAPAPFVYRRPTCRVGLLWTCWSMPYALASLVLQLSDDGHVPLGARIFMLAAGTLGALLIAVLPITAFVASDRVEEVPEASARS